MLTNAACAGLPTAKIEAGAKLEAGAMLAHDGHQEEKRKKR